MTVIVVAVAEWRQSWLKTICNIEIELYVWQVCVALMVSLIGRFAGQANATHGNSTTYTPVFIYVCTKLGMCVCAL